MNRGVETIANVLRYYIPQPDSVLVTFQVAENGVFALKNLTSAYGLGKNPDYVRKQVYFLLFLVFF